jgi:hypothetical protein
LLAAGTTLNTTALVPETYLRFMGPEHAFIAPRDRNHFFALAARAMRQIIADYARYEGARSGVAPTRSRRSQAAGRIDAEDLPRLMALDRILVSSRAQLPV